MKLRAFLVIFSVFFIFSWAFPLGVICRLIAIGFLAGCDWIEEFSQQARKHKQS